MPWTTRFFVFMIAAPFIAQEMALASPPRRERGTITCKTELHHYASGKGGGPYMVRGPSLTSSQYAPWDEKVHEYYGDVVFFHANGRVMPDIQPEFFLSIAYRIDNRDKEGFKEPMQVLMKLGDNRLNGSGILEHLVTFNPGEEFSLALEIKSQERLWFPKRYSDDRLTAVRATCERKAY